MPLQATPIKQVIRRIAILREGSALESSRLSLTSLCFRRLLDFRRSVTVDFATEVNFFDFRAGPDFRLHHILLSDWMGFLVWSERFCDNLHRTFKRQLWIERSLLGDLCLLWSTRQTAVIVGVDLFVEVCHLSNKISKVL